LRKNSQFRDSRLIASGSAPINDGDELAFVFAIMAFQPGSCPHPDLLKQTHEFCSFTGPQYGHGFFHVNRVLLEGSLDQVSTCLGESNDPRAVVPGVGSPPDQLS